MAGRTSDEQLHSETYAVIARVQRWVLLPIVIALVSGATAVLAVLCGAPAGVGAIIFVIGATSSTVWAYRSSRRLSYEVGRVDTITRSLAQGDLRARVSPAPTGAQPTLSTRLDAAVSVLTARLQPTGPATELLSIATTEMGMAGDTVVAGARDTDRQAATIAESATAVSASVEAMSAAGDELAGSITQISRNTTQASDMARSAVDTVARTTDLVEALRDSSTKIGDITAVITAVARQTNLLALNATIEAARAGEAGKGFAVVASEVKDLASKTEHASSEIISTINQISHQSTAAVMAMDEIKMVIDQIADFQSTIAAAVDEQSTTSTELGQRTREVASQTSTIVAATSNVSTLATATLEAAATSRSVVEEISRVGAELRRGVAELDLPAADNADAGYTIHGWTEHPYHHSFEIRGVWDIDLTRRYEAELRESLMKSRPGWWNVVDMRRLGPIESPEVQATHERLMALVIERQAKGTIHIVANSLIAMQMRRMGGNSGMVAHYVTTWEEANGLLRTSA
jgi:methyl-accepting chemotaxis protein